MNQSTLEKLFRQHHDRLLAEARAMLYDDAEAEDVVSELAYLCGSVRNRCRNVLSRKTLTERVTHLYALDQPTATEDEERERLDRLQAFIRTGLTEAQRRVFQLRFGEELKYREIAAELGISEVAVYKHLVAAITRIKNHFNY